MGNSCDDTLMHSGIAGTVDPFALLHCSIRQIVSVLGVLIFTLLASSSVNAQSTTGSAFFGHIGFLGDVQSRLDFGAGAFNFQGHQTDANSEGRVEFRYGIKPFTSVPPSAFLLTPRGLYSVMAGFIRISPWVASSSLRWRPLVVPVAAPTRTLGRPSNFASA